MSDFHNINKYNNFKKIIKDLNLKFPIAEISRITKYSKSNVSKYINGKLEPSDKFYNDFQKSFNVVIPEETNQLNTSNTNSDSCNITADTDIVKQLSNQLAEKDKQIDKLLDIISSKLK